MLSEHLRQCLAFLALASSCPRIWQWITAHGRREQLAVLPANDLDDYPWGDSFALTVQGLQVAYRRHSYSALTPYPELRPLVRPGTPLARMPQARGRHVVAGYRYVSYRLPSTRSLAQQPCPFLYP